MYIRVRSGKLGRGAPGRTSYKPRYDRFQGRSPVIPRKSRVGADDTARPPLALAVAHAMWQGPRPSRSRLVLVRRMMWSHISDADVELSRRLSGGGGEGG